MTGSIQGGSTPNEQHTIVSQAVAYPGFFEHWADSQQTFPGYWAIEANQKPTGP